MAIKRVEVRFKVEEGVWGEEELFPNLLPVPDGALLWSKDYPRDYPLRWIWREIRENTLRFFFDTFHFALSVKTAPPEPPTNIPEQALLRQTKWIRQKQARLPEFYAWNPDFKKWHMTREGYETRTLTYGGEIQIGVAEHPLAPLRGVDLLSELQRAYPGETRVITLFIYPDRYAMEFRCVLDLVITFW